LSSRLGLSSFAYGFGGRCPRDWQQPRERGGREGESAFTPAVAAAQRFGRTAYAFDAQAYASRGKGVLRKGKGIDSDAPSGRSFTPGTSQTRKRHDDITERGSKPSEKYYALIEARKSDQPEMFRLTPRFINVGSLDFQTSSSILKADGPSF
jgi:hypothetical protein